METTPGAGSQFSESNLTQSKQKLVWRQDKAGATEGFVYVAFAAPFTTESGLNEC